MPSILVPSERRSMVTDRHQDEAGLTARGHPVDRRPAHPGWDTAEHESNEEQRDRIAWNLPLPRRVALPLASESVAPLSE
jgi:hypothetical protein